MPGPPRILAAPLRPALYSTGTHEDQTENTNTKNKCFYSFSFGWPLITLSHLADAFIQSDLQYVSSK